jgi:integrase/recombinase XerD
MSTQLAVIQLPPSAVLSVIHHAEILPPADPDNWNYWIPRWSAEHAARTKVVYAKVITQFLQFIGWKSVSTLETIDIEAYQSSLAGLAKRTIGMRVAAVCSLVSFIHRRNLKVMPQNVGAPVKRVKIPNDLAERIMTEEQVITVIAAEKKPWKKALLYVYYGTGARSEELTRIQRKHITERPEGDGFNVIVHGKGGKTRVVPAFKGAAAAIASILPADPEAYLFPNKSGGQMSSVYASFLVTKAGQKAGLNKRISGHTMRHCHGSHATDRGAPIHVTSANMGHASIATTGRYLHINPKDGSGRYLAI